MRNVKIFFLDRLRVKLFVTQTLHQLNQPARVLSLQFREHKFGWSCLWIAGLAVSAKAICFS